MFVSTMLKASIQLGLFGFFVVFFGKPSLEMYLEKQVLTVTSKRDSGKVMPPAVTIAHFGKLYQNVSRVQSSPGLHYVNFTVFAPKGPRKHSWIIAGKGCALHTLMQALLDFK